MEMEMEMKMEMEHSDRQTGETTEVWCQGDGKLAGGSVHWTAMEGRPPSPCQTS